MKSNYWKIGFILLSGVICFNYVTQTYTNHIISVENAKHKAKVHRRAEAQIIDSRRKALEFGQMAAHDYAMAKFKEWLY